MSTANMTALCLLVVLVYFKGRAVGKVGVNVSTLPCKDSHMIYLYVVLES
jgi:hypothetical protein